MSDRHFLGPLELTRRTKVLVWDDDIEVPDPDASQEDGDPPLSPTMSVSSVPAPNRARSQSYGSDFPPPMRRTSTDASGAPRPVPFAHKFQRIHPGTTGVTVLEHLERLDAVEQSLQRLNAEEADEEEEVDMGVSTIVGAASAPLPSRPMPITRTSSDPMQYPGSPPIAGHGTEPLPPVPEGSGGSSRRSSLDEEDLVAMSKSTSHIEDRPPYKNRGRTEIGSITTAGLDWISAEADEFAHPKRKMIVEVRQSLALHTGETNEHQ